MLYVINGTLQQCLSFALWVDANARSIVRLVKMIDRSPSLMLQCGMSLMEFLTPLYFALGVDADARPVVRLVQMIDQLLSLMLQCNVVYH